MDVSSKKLITDAKFFIALSDDSAISAKKINIIDCIENGADVNVRFANYANNTPLHIAVMKGDIEVVNFLLKLGAKANIMNDAGKTAFDLAKDALEHTAIEDILGACQTGTETESSTVTTVFDETLVHAAVCEYKKRAGTANISGQLYETKLLTMIYFRVLRNKQIMQFHLGTNVDEIGDMDDVCLRFKTPNDDYIIFLQAKHKQDVTKGRLGLQDLWRTSGDFSLLKYFCSYRKIREKFKLSSDDELFNAKYEDVARTFVIYTTLKDDIKCSRKRIGADNIVANLIGTGNHCNIFQLAYEEQDIDSLTNALMIECIKTLGKTLFKLIQYDKCDVMLSDELIRRYHVVLAQKVINVTEINEEGRRRGSFREEFFSSNEELLSVLRESLYVEATKKSKTTRDIDVALLRISFTPDAETISELIGNALVYDTNDNTLKLSKEVDSSNINFQHLLEPLQIPQTVVSEALEIAGWKTLNSLTFNLPAPFGNIDMTINKKKSLRRLEYLADKLYDVIMETADNEGNVVIREGMYAPNKHLEAGVLAINGGFAGAVGNLFISDNKNTLKFNLDVERLGDNAKQLHLKLKHKLECLQKYRFFIETDDFPRLSLLPTEYEKRLARDFLDNLYFYTCQAKEEQLGEIVTKELQAHECSGGLSKSESRIKSNALFLKIHNEIQTWWMIDQTAYYLTRNMSKFDKIFRGFRNSGLLAYLNFIYITEMYNVGLEFNSEALHVFSVCKNDTSNAKIVVVNTDVQVLTCHKLMQYFRGADDYIFIDVDYVCQVSSKCLEIITAELNDNDISVVVMICKDLSKYNIKEILRVCNNKKIILVTSDYVPLEGCLYLRDERINLTDLTDASQTKILQRHFIYQGIEVKFADVFNSETKYLINSKILHKIINNENIILGKTLELSTYEEVKHYYVPRTLQLNKKNDSSDGDFSSSGSADEDQSSGSPKKLSPTTLIDHHSVFKNKQKKRTYDIILILDAPGMGKSTLLTHLSLETKKRYPDIWIQRINLIDHTKQFHEWHEHKIKVDSIEALKFVSQVVLTKEFSRNNNVCFPEDNIDLEIVNDEIKLVSYKEKDVLIEFELNIFLQCFKEGRIIFLFDGFDEICPHYKMEVTQLMKFLTRRCTVRDLPAEERDQKPHVQCIWITSRPYNDLRVILEKEFGESYTLQPFFYTQIRVFLDKYMRRNLNLNELNSKQLQNINGFFEYMKRFCLSADEYAKDVRLVNIPLHNIYVAAMEYFKSEIKRSHVTDDNLEYVKDWNIEANELSVWRNHFNNLRGLSKALTLSGVPLHVYIAIHYFLSQIKDTTLIDPEEIIRQWDLDTNAFAFYERFLEMKLKTIRFEEKNQMDLYNPDVKMTYEKEKKEFLEKHKKLAFYTICSKRIFTDIELDEISDIIKSMETAEDKTGLVDRIVDGEPRFVHYTFAEYFAVEYILDILKSGDLQKQERMLDYVLSSLVSWGSDGILNIFDLKFKFDPAFVAAMSTPHISRYIFTVLVEQSEVEYPYDVYDDYIGDPEDLTATALDRVVRDGLVGFADFLIDAVINTVGEDLLNFEKLMSLIEKGTFFKRLIVSWHDELVFKILDCIRRFDASRFDTLLPNFTFVNRIHSQTTNEEFVDKYRYTLMQKHYFDLLKPRNRHLSS